MTRHLPITPARFDASTPGPEKLWGLSSIASFLGVSVDKARRLSKLDCVPIHQPPGSGTYFATRTELNAWLRERNQT